MTFCLHQKYSWKSLGPSKNKIILPKDNYYNRSCAAFRKMGPQKINENNNKWKEQGSTFLLAIKPFYRRNWQWHLFWLMTRLKILSPRTTKRIFHFHFTMLKRFFQSWTDGPQYWHLNLFRQEMPTKQKKNVKNCDFFVVSLLIK